LELKPHQFGECRLTNVEENELENNNNKYKHAQIRMVYALLYNTSISIA